MNAIAGGYEIGARRIVQLGGEQNHRCCYCGIAVLYDVPDQHTEKATIDHVRPLAHKGKRVWENEVVACWLCNNSKGAMSAVAYFDLVQREGRVRPGRQRQAERKRASALLPRPPPPMSMKLREYLVLMYGAEKAEEIIAHRRTLANGWSTVELPG